VSRGYREKGGHNKGTKTDPLKRKTVSRGKELGETILSEVKKREKLGERVRLGGQGEARLYPKEGRTVGH